MHDDEDDAVQILDGEMTFMFGDESVPAPRGTSRRTAGRRARLPNEGAEPVRTLSIDAPAGFDRRIGLS